MAYIDEVEERDGDKVQKVFYSVLVKALDNHDQVGMPTKYKSFFHHSKPCLCFSLMSTSIALTLCIL